MAGLAGTFGVAVQNGIIMVAKSWSISPFIGADCIPLSIRSILSFMTCIKVFARGSVWATAAMENVAIRAAIEMRFAHKVIVILSIGSYSLS